MAIALRSKSEIEKLDKAGSIVARVLSKMKEAAQPGVTTAELNEMALDITKQGGGVALFEGVPSMYGGSPFPGAICASVNEEVVHGIPSHKRVLQSGDILSVDYGVKLNGYCGDAAVTIAVGDITEEQQRLMDVTKGLLDAAIEKCRPGVKWSAVAGTMEGLAQKAGFSVVTDFVGHGIGTEMHEDPKLPNFVSRDLLRNDIILKEGMIFAIEPMVNIGKRSVKVLRDGWTVVTRDGKCSAHFEHSVAIVKDGSKVLTAS